MITVLFTTTGSMSGSPSCYHATGFTPRVECTSLECLNQTITLSLLRSEDLSKFLEVALSIEEYTKCGWTR